MTKSAWGEDPHVNTAFFTHQGIDDVIDAKALQQRVTNTLSMARYFSPALRRRLAPLILIIGVLIVGRTAQNEMPKDQEVRFVLPPTQRNARSVRVTYLEEGEMVSSVEFRPDARPETNEPLVHTPSLKPGPYDVTIDIEDHNGVVHSLSRHLVVPTERVTFRLDPPKP